MISLLKFFLLIPLFSITNYLFGQEIKTRSIPGNIFSEIQQKKHSYGEDLFESLYFSALIPKNIVVDELEVLLENLGSFDLEKKIYKSSVQTKGDLLSIVAMVKKENKRTFIYVSDKDELKNELSINNIQTTFIKILKKRFINDSIIQLEKQIKKTDKKYNRIIRNNPNNLMMNSSFFYKIYQNNEAKKTALKSALDKLYDELESTKVDYISIK